MYLDKHHSFVPQVLSSSRQLFEKSFLSFVVLVESSNRKE